MNVTEFESAALPISYTGIVTSMFSSFMTIATYNIAFCDLL
jgi:hypothetical protein